MSRSRSTARWRRLLLSLLACAGLCAGCGESPESGTTETAPRNVLLVSIDTLRADHLGAWGYERDTSPALDRIAGRGLRFARAFVNTHGTPQSHTSLFASLSQESHRVGISAETGTAPSYIAPGALELLPEIFAAAGYRTVGVTGGAYMGRKFGLDQGFEEFDLRKGIAAQTETLFDRLASPTEDSRPVFAFLHTYEVHSPYVSPPEYQDLFGAWPSEFEPTSENLRALTRKEITAMTEEEVGAIVAAYDRGIRYTDDVLGRFLGELEALGFLDDAILLITSDHGEEFRERGRFLHPASLFDELLHVPLILVAPEVEPAVEEALVTSIDVAPTLLELVGIPVPEQMQGRDLLASDVPAPEFVVSQFGTSLYAVRTTRWKLMERTADGRLALFDLVADPKERRDVSRDHPEVVRQLRRQLREWRAAQPPVAEMLQDGPELSAEEEQQLRTLGYL